MCQSFCPFSFQSNVLIRSKVSMTTISLSAEREGESRPSSCLFSLQTYIEAPPCPIQHSLHISTSRVLAGEYVRSLYTSRGNVHCHFQSSHRLMMGNSILVRGKLRPGRLRVCLCLWLCLYDVIDKLRNLNYGISKV